MRAKQVTSLSQNALHSCLPIALLAATFVATLSGCPGGGELEHPEKYFSGSPGTGTGGSGATGGMGAGGMAPTDVPLPTVAGCDVVSILNTKCAGVGCHRAGPLTPADLLLVPDNGFVSRVRDVPATHADIYCGTAPCAEVPATCPKGDFLVDSGDSTKSWILLKMNNTNGCGDLMPPSTFAPEDKTCLENLVKAIADLP